MNNDAPIIKNYLFQIWYYYIFNDINIYKNISIINTINKNCYLKTVVSKCGVTYAEIFERIWSISNLHKHKIEIRKILKDEIFSGMNLCFTGQVTRLVNSLCGFIDNIHIGYSENEQINNAVIATMRMCKNNNLLNVKEEIKKVLDELLIPNSKQLVWLNAID